MTKDINNLIDEISRLKKEQIENLHWADLTLKELELITDSEKKRKYREAMNDFHVIIINTFSTLVPNDFKFSVSDELLTYRIMATDYMNYFYSKGMTREQIIEMMINNTPINNKGKHK